MFKQSPPAPDSPVATPRFQDGTEAAWQDLEATMQQDPNKASPEKQAEQPNKEEWSIFLW